MKDTLKSNKQHDEPTTKLLTSGKTEDLPKPNENVEYQATPKDQPESIDWIPSDEKTENIYRMKSLSLKLVIGCAVLIVLGALIYGGWFYYTLNTGQKPITVLQNPTSQDPVTKPPASLTLEIQQPEDNLLTFQSSIVISGKTNPNLPVIINNQATDTVVYSKSDGNFSTVLTLEEGVNAINIAVFDDSGDKRNHELTVFYSEEKI